MDHYTELIRNVFKLDKGCQFYGLSQDQYWDLVSHVSNILVVDASTSSQILSSLIDQGNININDEWSNSISYTAKIYGVDAALAAQLLSIGLPDLPTDESLTNKQWTDAISAVSQQFNVNAAEAAQLLSINMNERRKERETKISLEQWNNAISTVSQQYKINAAEAAKLLSSTIKLDNITINSGQYQVKCRTVPHSGY
jgi:hypothetical protein